MDVKPNEIKFLQDDRLINSQQIYDGAILQLYVNKLKNERDQIIERELIHHRPAVAILPITDSGDIILIRQYREAIAQYIYEVPAGVIDMVNNQLEDPLTAAKRELEEETGYQGREWTYLRSFYLSPGFMDEKIHLYLARGLKKQENPLPQDEDEVIELFTFSPTEIEEMLDKGEIVDIKTLYAIEKWLGGSFDE